MTNAGVKVADTEVPAGPRVRRTRCAPAADERGDPLEATAAPAQRFVLCEQPGPWGREAVRRPDGSGPISPAVHERAAELGARILAIRPVFPRDPLDPHRCAVVDARPGRERTWWSTYSSEQELLELLATEPPGDPSTEPLYLVCTHGSHDPCCGTRGWPAARALAGAHPGRTWQCSHVGGDRFAANLLVLPHGLYYGRATPEIALEIADAYEAGRIALPYYRGRSAFAPHVQAAQHYARAALDVTALDALAPLGARSLPGDAWEVELDHAGATARVVVRAGAAPGAARLTCGASAETRARIWELVELEA